MTLGSPGVQLRFGERRVGPPGHFKEQGDFSSFPWTNRLMG